MKRLGRHLMIAIVVALSAAHGCTGARRADPSSSGGNTADAAAGMAGIGAGATADAEAEGGGNDAGGATGGQAGASTGGTGGVGACGGYPSQSGKCQNEQASMVGFVRANKGCSVDTDCVFVQSRSDIRDHCSGGFYLNKSYDKSGYAQIEEAVKTCLGQDSNYCAATPDPPVCWDSMCVGAGLSPPAVRDQCVKNFGSDDACARCTCGLCLSSQCGWLSECHALTSCARKASCLGLACGDPSSPTFPCQAELAKAPCASAGSYFHLNQCLTNWQCAAECSPG